MLRSRRSEVAFQRRIALAVAAGLLVTLDEITEQHYYRARFAHRRMYIPLVLGPPAVLAALLRAVSPRGWVRGLYRLMNQVMVVVGLLGFAFHWAGNLSKYEQKEEQDQLPGETGSQEDKKHGRPYPDVELAGYNVGQLLEVGARGRPWMAPLALTGLGMLALLADE